MNPALAVFFGGLFANLLAFFCPYNLSLFFDIRCCTLVVPRVYRGGFVAYIQEELLAYEL